MSHASHNPDPDNPGKFYVNLYRDGGRLTVADNLAEFDAIMLCKAITSAMHAADRVRELVKRHVDRGVSGYPETTDITF